MWKMHFRNSTVDTSYVALTGELTHRSSLPEVVDGLNVTNAIINRSETLLLVSLYARMHYSKVISILLKRTCYMHGTTVLCFRSLRNHIAAR
jgi:hypothetical protein